MAGIPWRLDPRISLSKELELEASLALKADQSTADLIKSNTSLIPALL